MVQLVAATRTLFGGTLPSDWLGWLVLLVSIWSALSVFQVVVAAFIDQHKRRPITFGLSGDILPGGWIVWGGLLIYGIPQAIPVLIVLLGLLIMLIAVSLLRQEPPKVSERKAKGP